MGEKGSHKLPPPPFLNKLRINFDFIARRFKLPLYGGEDQSPQRRQVVNPVRSGRKQPQQPRRVLGVADWSRHPHYDNNVEFY